jgi:hypothetical protein
MISNIFNLRSKWLILVLLIGLGLVIAGLIYVKYTSDLKIKSSEAKTAYFLQVGQSLGNECASLKHNIDTIQTKLTHGIILPANDSPKGKLNLKNVPQDTQVVDAMIEEDIERIISLAENKNPPATATSAPHASAPHASAPHASAPHASAPFMSARIPGNPQPENPRPMPVELPAPMLGIIRPQDLDINSEMMTLVEHPEHKSAHVSDNEDDDDADSGNIGEMPVNIHVTEPVDKLVDVSQKAKLPPLKIKKSLVLTVDPVKSSNNPEDLLKEAETLVPKKKLILNLKTQK